MPRVPYFQGNIASAAQTQVTPNAPSYLEAAGDGLARGFSGLFRGDGNAARDDLYSAQAGEARARTAGEVTKNNVALGQSQSVRGLGDADLGDPDTEHLFQSASTAYNAAVAQGADPKMAMQALSGKLALYGKAGDDVTSRLVYVFSGGKGLASEGGSEAIGTDAQAGFNAAYDARATADKERESATQRYGFDTQATTSRSNNAEDNATSRSNNAATNGTSLTTAKMREANQRLTDDRLRDSQSDMTTTTEVTPAVAASGAHGGWFGVPQTYDTPAIPARRVETKSSSTRKGASATAAAAAPAGKGQSKIIKYDNQGNVIG